MKKFLYIILSGCVLLFSSCESYLDRSPSRRYAASNFFVNESSLIKYTNGFLNSYTPSYSEIAEGCLYTDNVGTYKSTEFLYMVQWSSSLQSGWSSDDWNSLYNINYFLQHVRDVPELDEAAYLHYEGTGRFWRAWVYWEKVKAFGAVPWYDKPVDAEDEEALYKPRDSREYVMDRILEDLDFACENIYASSDWVNCARVSKYVALVLKSRICLYEGTFRKYHTEDPSTGQPWEDDTASERFLRACAEACEEMIDAGVYRLVDSSNDSDKQTQYQKLFKSENISYVENIWVREYNLSMDTRHYVTSDYMSSSSGYKPGLDQDFVQTYLHHDGSRHYEKIAERQAAGEDVTLTTELFADETADRDYRLQQQIITPGYRKTVGSVDSLFSPVLSNTVTGYQLHKWCMDNSEAEVTKNSYNSLPMMRYAEVLLNYAEAKCELGEFDQEIWDSTIKPLRERSGVDGRRRTDIDPYLAEYYGISDCDLVEIRRERAIELLLENSFREDDLYRWHLGDLFNKQWYGIYIPEKGVAYDLDGNGRLDVCVVDSSSDSYPSNVTSVIFLEDSAYSLENGDSGRLVYSLERYFDDQRYLRPIPDTALDINPALGQNYYWIGF